MKITMNKLVVIAFALILSCVSFAQPTFPYNGIRPKDVTSVAFTHATLFVDFQTKIEDATLVIEKGRIIGAGRNIAIPSNAVIIDLKGKYIYPSFIDLYSDYGISVSAGSEKGDASVGKAAQTGGESDESRGRCRPGCALEAL